MLIRKSSLTLIAAGIVTAAITSVVILTVRPDAESISLVPQDKKEKWTPPLQARSENASHHPEEGRESLRQSALWGRGPHCVLGCGHRE